MLFSPQSQAEIRRSFRMRVERRDALLLPGAATALTARIIEDLGFEAVYLTGAGLANTHLGVPDLGLVSVTELAETAARISDVCRLPLVVDIDTGFGNALNVYRTVYSNGLAPPHYRSKTRSSRKNAAISPAKALSLCPRCWVRSKLRLMRVAM
jgi:isocitrate lyase